MVLKKRLSLVLTVILLTAVIISGCSLDGNTAGHSVRQSQESEYEVRSAQTESPQTESPEEETYITCPVCNGAQTQTCTWCNGTGYMELMGEKVDCHSCGATGKQDCFRCSGTGVIENPDRQSASASTIDPNQLPPDYYDNGRQGTVCSRCGGSGMMTCPTCHGTGTTDKTVYAPDYGNGGGLSVTDRRCSMCGGARQIQCSLCFGKGVVG